MHGFLNVLKPPGMTSHDVVNFLRKALSLKKVGHLGTLDPGAGGVLPLAIGKSTRLIEYVSDSTKGYRAEITLGISTDTYDAFGKVMAREHVGSLSGEKLQAVLDSFIGHTAQKPPGASAVRIKGKHLYEYHRSGISVEAPLRSVIIESIAIILISLPRIIIDVVCGAGTYIRSLCHDIGKSLGWGAHMSFLVRYRSGHFTIGSAHTINEIIAAKDMLDSLLIPPEKVLTSMPRISVSGDSRAAILHGSHGRAGTMSAYGLKEGDLVIINGDFGEMLAIGRILSPDPLVVKPVKVL
jgi:tRNA pseudouridine55 synthase